MNLKGIIFDMDGTLGDTMPIVVEALRDTFRRYGGRDYSPAEVAIMFGPAEEGVISRRVPQDVFPAALQNYLERYSALHEQSNQPFPGVIDLLQALQARGIHRGVVTGKGRGTAEISMRALGLEPYIETLVTGSAAGAEKPEAIQRVLAEWGIQPQEAAYVGDMPYDMRAAREAGVLPLGAAWAESATVAPEDGLLIFDSVAALQAWLLAQA